MNNGTQEGEQSLKNGHFQGISEVAMGGRGGSKKFME